MSVVYRGYKIEQHWVSRTSEKQDEFVYSHEDYDGPGDRRCGHAVGLRNCLDEIDWIEDEIALQGETLECGAAEGDGEG